MTNNYNDENQIVDHKKKRIIDLLFRLPLWLVLINTLTVMLFVFSDIILLVEYVYAKSDLLQRLITISSNEQSILYDYANAILIKSVILGVFSFLCSLIINIVCMFKSKIILKNSVAWCCVHVFVIICSAFILFICGAITFPMY